MKEPLRWIAIALLVVVGLGFAVDVPELIWHNEGLGGFTWIPVAIKVGIVVACWAGVRRLAKNLQVHWRVVGLGLITLAALGFSISIRVNNLWNAVPWLIVGLYGALLALFGSPRLRSERRAGR